jgi:NADPH:quinone reductase-like Zn-dependent oxidoreductase/quercetin dioxygenase-like cupin family protein
MSGAEAPAAAREQRERPPRVRKAPGLRNRCPARITTEPSPTRVATERLPDVPGRTLTAAVVDLAPGRLSPPHRHPGFVLAYVLAGTASSRLGDGPAVNHRAGQGWAEPPGTPHSLAEKPSPTEPAHGLGERGRRRAARPNLTGMARPAPERPPAHQRAPDMPTDTSTPSPSSPTMRAARVHRFGPPDAIVVERVPRPMPGEGEVLVRVVAAGVGPWDGWIRAGRSVLPQPLPLTPGSDLSGVVEAVGTGVTGLRPGDEVYGVTNGRFTGAYAEYALAEAGRLAPKPQTLDHARAAAVPVVAVTAWQMLLDHARVAAGRRVLVHGAAGAVGAYAVQLARRAGAHVIGTARGADVDRVRELGADEAVDVDAMRFEAALAGETVDVVVDLVGGEAQARSLEVLGPGGVLVSAVSEPDREAAARRGVRAFFMLVDVTGAALAEVARLLDEGKLRAGEVGEVLPLERAALAHRMLEGAAPRRRGKIVLRVAAA